MEFTYRKIDGCNLGENWKVMNFHEAQSYIPIYTTFFALSDVNFSRITLNQKSVLEKIDTNVSSNIYKCVVNGTVKDVFFKEAPLLDTVKYLTGKYDMGDDSLFRLPTFEDKGSHPKVSSPNNASYVDGFFAYLSSEILHRHNFVHGVDFYGSFLGIKHDYLIDMVDDIDILCDSDFFQRENGHHFFLESGFETCGDTRKNRPPLSLSPTVRTTDHVVNISNSGEWEESVPPSDMEGGIDLVFESDTARLDVDEDDDGSATEDDEGSATEDDEGSATEDDGGSDTEDDEGSATEDDGSSDTEGDGDSDISTEDDHVFVTIPKFPIQAIALEKCTDTLDHLLLENDVSDEELGSMVFQIVMTLIAYQKAYDFTHNDLHTCNIMYKETDKTHIFYRYGDRYYRVPTYGRVYKIIDFGRAIYKFRGKRLCSDSYHPEGDAATMYNCEPYYNEFKPTIEPNPSFDLCRLGCALFDFLVDDPKKLHEESDVVRLIIGWCFDDKGRNILYKKSGAERYPEFRLYKMIARTVHNCVPHEVFQNEFFEQYLFSKKKMKQHKYINVDEIPDYSTL